MTLRNSRGLFLIAPAMFNDPFLCPALSGFFPLGNNKIRFVRSFFIQVVQIIAHAFLDESLWVIFQVCENNGISFEFIQGGVQLPGPGQADSDTFAGKPADMYIFVSGPLDQLVHYLLRMGF